MTEKSWAFTRDRSARTAPARAASWERFEREVDPEGQLEPEERSRRAASARTEFYRAMSAKGLAAQGKHRKGCQLPEDHTSECRRASNPNFGGAR